MQQKKNWFLRKNDGSEYGPVSLDDLLRWSAQCRLIAGNAVSTDREEWTPVEALPELEMDWVALRADGKEYGPFALEAVQELFDHEVLPADAVLVNHRTGEKRPLAEVIARTSPDPDDDPQQDEPEDDGSASPEPAAGTPLEEEADTPEDIVAGTEETPASAEEAAPEAIAAGSEETPASAEEATPEPSAHMANEKPRAPRARKESRSARRPASPEQPELPGALPEPIPDPAAGPEEAGETAAVPSGGEFPAGGETGEAGPATAAGEELANVRKALEDSIRLRGQEAETFNRASEALRRQVESLQRKLGNIQKESATQIAAQAGEYQSLQVELDRARIAAREAGIRLEALEAERGHAVQESAEDLADLRKQTAFMKKNIAVLHAEVETARKQSQRRGRILLALGAILTLAIAVQMMRAASGGCRRSRPEATAAGAPPEPAAASGEIREPAPQSGPVPAPGVRDTRPPAVATQPTWPSLRAEGVRISTDRDRLMIRFDDGVFSSLTTLTPEAGRRLRSLADQLRPHMDRFRLVVEGHSDDIPMRPTAAFADNQALAAARGEAVAAFLRREGALPAAAVTAAAIPGTPPYPNDTPENRRRNRTAVLRLVPRTTPQ